MHMRATTRSGARLFVAPILVLSIGCDETVYSLPNSWYALSMCRVHTDACGRNEPQTGSFCQYPHIFHGYWTGL
ncbi:hypothetical protein EV426DRAFT_581556 [Tirmania nivea]|nr:hypothetical protein EV426DRAFT_581556 [Tirmania nivea]